MPLFFGIGGSISSSYVRLTPRDANLTGPGHQHFFSQTAPHTVMPSVFEDGGLVIEHAPHLRIAYQQSGKFPSSKLPFISPNLKEVKVVLMILIPFPLYLYYSSVVFASLAPQHSQFHRPIVRQLPVVRRFVDFHPFIGTLSLSHLVFSTAPFTHFHKVFCALVSPSRFCSRGGASNFVCASNPTST